MSNFRSLSTSAVIIAVAAVTTCANALSVGEAMLIERNVSGKPASGPQPLKRIINGDEVYQQEVVQTEELSRGQFSFLDTTVVELGPRAKMKIDSVIFGEDRSVRKLTVTAENGALRWISGTSNSQAYLINTPYATVTVMGTMFDLLVEPRQTLVLLQAGQIEVCLINAPRRCKTLSQSGDRILVTSGNLVDLGPSRARFADFEGECLSADRSPCAIQTVSRDRPSPPSNPPNGSQRRADRTQQVIRSASSTTEGSAPPTGPSRELSFPRSHRIRPVTAGPDEPPPHWPVPRRPRWAATTPPAGVPYRPPATSADASSPPGQTPYRGRVGQLPPRGPYPTAAPRDSMGFARGNLGFTGGRFPSLGRFPGFGRFSGFGRR
jgi:hypothetical protein